MITIVVASSRVLLGVHWLTDVIAGVVVGWTWFLLVTVLFGGRLLRFGEPVERIKRTAGVDEPAPSVGAAEPISLSTRPISLSTRRAIEPSPDQEHRP
jgi:hypothetical protein